MSEEKTISELQEIVSDVDGIDQKVTDGWKIKYGTIFLVMHLGKPYVYRGFNYKEYKEIRKLLAEKYEQTKIPITIEDEMEEILSRCILHPSNFKKEMEEGNVPGGLPSVIYDSIMQASGFVELYPEILSSTNG